MFITCFVLALVSSYYFCRLRKLADFLSSRSETEQEVSMQLLSLQTLHSSTGTIHQAHMAQLEITALELYRQCGDED